MVLHKASGTPATDTKSQLTRPYIIDYGAGVTKRHNKKIKPLTQPVQVQGPTVVAVSTSGHDALNELYIRSK
jgi:hypothetical protein